MSKYRSSITFLYYDDYERAKKFYTSVLQLDCVMDQGFACVYQINPGSFLGCVKRNQGSIDSLNKGGALISLTVEDVESVYKEYQKAELPYLSELKLIESIPLKSFFFKDFEGYDFEVQEFLKKEDKEFF